jgi:8-oxo-dGTP diphosphatase
LSDIIEVVTAVIRDAQHRMLVVRKRGTATFMKPGGKREPGEDDLTALVRELAEELGCGVASARLLGVFEAPAANEPGLQVRAVTYSVEAEGAIVPAAEIEEIAWVDPASPGDLALAPLIRRHAAALMRDG